MLLDGLFNIVTPFQFLLVQVPPFLHMHNQFNNCVWHDRSVRNLEKKNSSPSNQLIEKYEIGKSHIGKYISRDP